MPITSIPANDRRERFVASGGQTVFTFDFPVFAATDLRVTRLRAGVETVLAFGADYTVTGANEQAGGSITLTTGATAADIILIESAMPVQRAAQFQNGGPLPADAIEGEFNRILIALQQYTAQALLAVRAAATDTREVRLPPATTRALKFLATDVNGDIIAAEGGVSGVPISTFMATVNAAADAAAARALLSVWGRAETWVDVASAATTDIGAAASPNLRITGTTQITSLGAAPAGTTRQLRFAAALTLTHNATSLILPGSVSIVTAADDRLVAVSLGSGNWIITSFTPAAGYGWQPIGGIQVATSQATVDIALPTAFSAYRFTAWRLAPSANAGILWRISTDGGVSFRAGGTDYDTAFQFANSATPQSGSGSGSSVDLTGAILVADNRSRLHIPFIDPGSGSHRASVLVQAGILDSGSLTRNAQVSGAASANGRATHMRILPSAGTLSCAFLLEGMR
jgi:hypothetical protein